MGKHVISTLTADNQYNDWVNHGGMNSLTKSVLVRGGAGVANRQFVTPDGVRTPVTNEEAEFLSNHALFREHQERGFVKIINIDRDPNSVAQAMSKDDGSRPRNDGDVERFVKDKKLDKEEKLQVVTNKR